jgi:hypothetical protein
MTTFTCPRCGNEARARFYGPCETCRADLASRFAVAAAATSSVDGDDAVYEPKMNVTPNFIATKD